MKRFYSMIMLVLLTQIAACDNNDKNTDTQTNTAVVTKNRPQTPIKPYPYKEVELTYKNQKDDITLAGTLTIPKGDGPFPAALLITGSGPQDRDVNIFGHKVFLVLADYLTRQGIAVLRVDDRGVGGSSGSVDDSTTSDFANDVLAGVDALKKRPEVDPNKIGLVGHSEGGIVAPIAATRSEEIAYIVLMAGPGLPGAELIRLQMRKIMEAEKISQDIIDKLELDMTKSMDALQTIKDPEKLQRTLHEIYANVYQYDPNAASQNEDDYINQNIARMNSTWMRYFLSYDPRPTLTEVTCPVLAVLGGKDLQVPPKENLPEIQQALEQGQSSQYEVIELAGMNHLFQTANTGSPSEYTNIEETLSPKLLELVATWIKRTTAI